MLDAARARRPRLGAGAGPLIGLRISLGPALWRIGPAWAVLAGALSGSISFLPHASPLQLVGAALLADSAWGVLWRLTALDEDPTPDPQTQAGLLPFFQEQSPAGRALGTLRRVAAGASWVEVAAALALNTVLCLLLGLPALIITVMAGAMILWGWALTQAGKQPAACDALLNTGLPWLLGVVLVQPALTPVHLAAATPALVLGVAFTALQWGARRAYLSDGKHMWGAWLGQGAVLLVLVGLREPWILAVVAALFVLPTWWLWRISDREAISSGVALTRSSAWWLAAMLLATLALR